jgi:hypothetical protein
MKIKKTISKKAIERMRMPGGYSYEECMGIDMTPKERNVFLAIDQHWKTMGYGPSYDDIMRITGDKGRGGLVRIVNNLCKIGVCKKIPNKDRSVRPVYVNFRDLQ